MSTKVWTNRQPWKSSEVQPIVLAGSRKHQVPSFYEATTIVEYVPGYQKSYSHSCNSCGTPNAANDVFCGWCGVRLGVR